MKIVYFYQYFATPKGSWGTRVYEFTKEWVEQGHDVTVVTSIYSKSDLTAEKLIEDQIFEGIKVKVINVTIDNKQGFLKRIWTFIQYSFLACFYAIKLPADVVIASSGPITVGLPGLVANIVRGRKLVFEVRDLWPEGAIELGVLNNKMMQKLAYWFEKKCYQRSKLVVALSPGMQQNIQQRFPKINVISVPNSANIPLFAEAKPIDNLPSFFKDKKVAIYTGNIGKVNNSELLLKTAQLLQKKGREDILILMIGEGQQKEWLLENSKNLSTLKMQGLMPKNDLVAYVQNSMVSLVPLRGTPVLDTSSPNKLFESLAAGVPVVQTTQGWIKDFLTQEDCGKTVDADNEQELVDALITYADNQQLKIRQGEKGREVAKREFDKDYLANKMLEGIIKYTK